MTKVHAFATDRKIWLACLHSQVVVATRRLWLATKCGLTWQLMTKTSAQTRTNTRLKRKMKWNRTLHKKHTHEMKMLGNSKDQIWQLLHEQYRSRDQRGQISKVALLAANQIKEQSWQFRDKGSGNTVCMLQGLRHSTIKKNARLICTTNNVTVQDIEFYCQQQVKFERSKCWAKAIWR